MYSNEQKTLVMLYSDILDSPLTANEKAIITSTLKQSESTMESALRVLPVSISKKIDALLGQGMRFTLEMKQLDKRGISIIFPDEKLSHIADYFIEPPRVLFTIGNNALLEDTSVPVSFSLAEFKNAGGHGIFFVDRAFDCVLRDAEIAASLRQLQALLISDLIRQGASVDQTKSNQAKVTKTQKVKRTAISPQKPRNRPLCVFISGSRSQSEISKNVQESLDTIIDQGLYVLIGDSDKGVDKEIADYLRMPLYENVIVYSVSKRPRIEVEKQWHLDVVDVKDSLTGQKRQMVKDRAMAEKADYGMAIFNPVEKNRYGSLQASAGTLRNAIQLLQQHKMVKFFYRYEGIVLCKNLKTLQDLEDILDSYQRENLPEAERRVILSAKGVTPESDAASVKYRTLMAKYNALVREENSLHLSLNGKETISSRPSQETLPLF